MGRDVTFDYSIGNLITERFDDSNFASRGWYDLGGSFVLDSSNPHSGSNSLRFTYQMGNSLPDTGWSGRIKFVAVTQLYIEFWARYSTNWVGSGQTAQPHEWQFLTNLDGDFQGPANSHLSMLIEHNYQSGLVGRVGAQDHDNIDQSEIGNDITGTTELRGAHGCNGFLETTHTGSDCFDQGGGDFTNARRWDDSGVTISDANKDNWNKIGVFIKLNSISGGIGQEDGEIKYWLNGSSVMNHQGVVIRTGEHANMKFDQLLLLPFIGAGAPVTQSVWFDDLIIQDREP